MNTSGLSHVKKLSALALPAVLILLGSVAPKALAQRPVKERRVERSASDFAARRLLKKGQDVLMVGEEERGTKMLEAVVEQYPESTVRFEAWLALGKHYIETFQQPQAIIYLAKIRQLERDPEQLKGNLKEIYLEGLYLTGMAYYQTKQFSKAFPVLRKITSKYQNTSWANESYYYIGMCHFAQSNWNKAIEALNLVGTFVDPNSPEVEFVEAGRRFYVKIEDGDLPVLKSLGREIKLNLRTDAGDEEIVEATKKLDEEIQ